MRSIKLTIVVCFILPTSFVAAVDEVGMMFIKDYCIQCHGPKKQEGDLRLDKTFELPKLQRQSRWQKIHQLVTQRKMPPEGAPQFNDYTRARFLAWISSDYGEKMTPGDHWAFQPLVRPQIPDGPKSQNPIDAFVNSRLEEKQLKMSAAASRRILIRRATLDLIGLPPSPEEVEAFLNDRDSDKEAFARVVDRLLRSPHYGERWAQHWLDVIRWAETVGFETNLERTNAWHYRDWVIDALNADKRYDRFVFEQLAGDTVGADAALGFLVAGPANLPGQIGRDEEAMRQARQDELDEVIRTVSQSLFGLTIGCARCHDHKFDPISQRDYYAMQANFSSMSYGHRRLRGQQNDEWNQQVPASQKKFQELRNQYYTFISKYKLQYNIDSTDTTFINGARTADAVRMEINATRSGPASLYEFQVHDISGKNVALPENGGKPSASSFALANQTRHFDNLVDGSQDRRQSFPWVAAKAGPAWIQIDLKEPVSLGRIIWYAGSSTPADFTIKIREAKTGKWIEVSNSLDRMPAEDDLRAAKDIKLKGVSPEGVREIAELLAKIRKAKAEWTRLLNGPQVYAAKFDLGTPTTYLRVRGDAMQLGEEVGAGVPMFLENKKTSERFTSEMDRRIALARHLTKPDHPLTSRVIVNRIWQHHFGVGLVETPSDFGRMGNKPSHPKLLDWLATEFVARGWSIKKLHRLIVNSDTYRQSSQPRAAALAIDANSRLLWRFPPRRLDAEAIRDSILTVSGKLNKKMHGRGFDFFDRRGGLSDYTPKETFNEDGWRRMIYAHKIRMESVDIFGSFDCPDAGQMTPRRSQSITPIQSLGLFNSPFSNRQAKFFAERVQKHAGDDLGKSVNAVFEIALSRLPTEVEHERLLTLAQNHGLEQVCRVIFNSSEFVYLP